MLCKTSSKEFLAFYLQMANFDDTQGRPVSSLFSAPIPADTGGAPNASGKVPFPGNPGSR